MKIINNKVNSVIWRYYFFVFLKDFSLLTAVLVPFYTEWGHISLAKVQILQSWFVLWIFFLEVPTGAVADYLGRKYSLTLGAIITSLAVLVYGSVPRFEVFLIGEFFFAMGVALISGADSALLYDSLKEVGREKESKKVFGKAHSFCLLGLFVSAPIGGYIAARFGLNAPMLFSAIPFLLAGCVAWSMKEPKVQSETTETKRYLEIVKKGFSYFRHHKTLRLLACDAIVVASAAYFVVWLYQPLFIKLKVPIIYFGWLHALLVAAEILIANNFVKLEKLFGSGKNYLRFTAIITSSAFFLVAAFPSLITATLLVILAGGFGITRIELMFAYMNKFIPSEQRATVISSISMFRRLALVFLNPVIGFTADYSLRSALFVVGLLPLLVFLFSPIEQELLEPAKVG